MRNIVEVVEGIFKAHKPLTTAPANCILLHCWRGGMRSAGVAWLLDLYGFKVYTLSGGYKTFRNWVLAQFERSYSFNIIGGYTGSGKTQILKNLAATGYPVIDLEGIAHHKGSAFGALGEEKQPTQEMFENILAQSLIAVDPSVPVWLEDESRRIGNINLPNPLWDNIRRSDLVFLRGAFLRERLGHIVKEYGRV